MCYDNIIVIAPAGGRTAAEALAAYLLSNDRIAWCRNTFAVQSYDIFGILARELRKIISRRGGCHGSRGNRGYRLSQW